MILRFKNVEAWRQAILGGIFSSEALGAPSVMWNYGATGKIAEIEDSFIVLKSSEIQVSGVNLLSNPPTSKAVSLDGLWKLFGPIPSGTARFSIGKAYLIRFSRQADAEPFCLELFRLGDHGVLRHLAVEGSYWMWASSLPHLTWLGLVDKSGVDVFEETSPGLWIPVGTRHPLEGIVKNTLGILLKSEFKAGQSQPAGDWRIFFQSSTRDHTEIILSAEQFTPLFEDIDWRIPKAISHEAASAIWPRWNIPIGLRLDESFVGTPDLWVVDPGKLDALREWLARATPDLRESFRYGVLEGDHGKTGSILLLRIRELPPSPGGEPPGFSLLHKRSNPGLYLPSRSRIYPDPGPEMTRKLLGLSPERMVWLVPDENKGFVPHFAARSVFGPLENLVRFLIEREAQALKSWANRIEFSWENVPLLEETPVTDLSLPGAGPDPAEQSGSIQKPSQVEPKKKGRPSKKIENSTSTKSEKDAVSAETSPVVSSIVSNPPLHSATLPKAEPSEGLVEAFESAEGAWDSQIREALWPQLALAWITEGKTEWSALAFIHDHWKDEGDWASGLPFSFGVESQDAHDSGLRYLKLWHESLARQIGKMSHPPLGELFRDWLGEKVGPEQKNWFLTGLAMARNPENDSNLGLSTFQAIHDILLRDCTDASVRLQWFAWLSLARIFGNSTAALGGGERLLVRVLEEGIRPATEWPRPLVAKSKQDSSGRGTGTGLHQAYKGVMDWLASQGIATDTCQTLSIAQWTFAYGFARIGEGEKARELGEAAQKNLAREPLGALLSRAYAHRVSQAIMGTQASGPLESPWLREAASFGKWTTFALDYIRETSRILEPHQAVRAFPAGDPLSRVLDPLGHPGALGRLCRESAPATPGQADAQSRWTAILDRILILPAADAVPLLEGAQEYLLAVAKPGAISMRMGARILAGGVFYQKSNLAILEWMTRWLGSPPVIGNWLGGKSPGMDKGFFQFITRQTPLLLQLGERGMVEAILGALNQGVSGLESCETKNHARFLLDCAGNCLMEGPGQNLESLETRILDEVQGLQHFNQQRNEPWQALCHKVVAYIQALASAEGQVFREKLVSIPRWIQPIRDHFATAPKPRETTQRLCYQRHQVEWIEALVLAISEASPVRVPEWVIADEKLVRVRIRKDLAGLEKLSTLPMNQFPENPKR